MDVQCGGVDLLCGSDVLPVRQAPVDVQCGGVDLDGDGVFECLVTGSSRLMALINMDKRQYTETRNTACSGFTYWSCAVCQCFILSC